MRFLISTLVEDATTSLYLRGDLDLAAHTALRKAIEEALRAAGNTAVTVDLTDVTFLDCTGIGALVHGRRVAKDLGRAYRIQNARGLPMTMLHLTGVLRPDEWEP